MNQKRIHRVLDALAGLDVSQMLITDPMSIYYLTGEYVEPYERFYALYLDAEGRTVFFLNRLFPVREDLPIQEVWLSDTDSVTDALCRVIDPERKLGVDKDIRARFLLPLMERNAAAGFMNASSAVDRTRAVKDSEEQAKMRRASAINDAAMAQFKALIHEGVTEREVAAQIPGIYHRLGADGLSFPSIVSFGKNAADPHHSPDGTVLKEGDCVLFDVGCIADGYCSDMTRTFFFRTVSPQHRAVYELVRRANEEAEKKIQPGVKLQDLDKTARDIISEAGYGEAFNHRLGHFIGLTDHEYGDVSSAFDWNVKPGMIFSIEPGVYLKGDMGVRIEDLNLVTEDGCETLNHYPKELEVI